MWRIVACFIVLISALPVVVHAQTSEPGSKGLPFPVWIVEDADSALRTNERDASDDEHDAKDLLAQEQAAAAAERSAKAAEDQLIPLRIQTVIAVVGTVALVITIWLNFAATRAAWRSADLAEEAVKKTEAAMQKQLRAYMQPFEFPFEHVKTPRGHELQLRCRWGNVGQTPPQRLRLNIAGVVQAGDLSDDFDFEFEDHSLNTFLGLGNTIETMPFSLNATDVSSIVNGSMRVFLWSTAKYADVYDQDHITRCCVELFLNHSTDVDPNILTVSQVRWSFHRLHNSSEDGLTGSASNDKPAE